MLLGRVMRQPRPAQRALRAKAAQLERRAGRASAEPPRVDERTPDRRRAARRRRPRAQRDGRPGGRRPAARRARPRRRRATAFAAVETTGREALTEIRRLLGVLRREDEEIALAPQPSLRHVDALVARARARPACRSSSRIDGERARAPGRRRPDRLPASSRRRSRRALEQGAAGARAGAPALRAPTTSSSRSTTTAARGERDAARHPRARRAVYGGRCERRRAPRRGGHSVRARLPVEGAS